MAAVLIFGFIAIVIVLVKALSANKGARSYNQVQATGLPARGLVLAASPLATGVTMNGVRYERRSMKLDVEVSGQPPYVVDGSFLVPRGLIEPIPGASLDLAVNPSNAYDIAVLGPGGFSGPWLRTGMPNQY